MRRIIQHIPVQLRYLLTILSVLVVLNTIVRLIFILYNELQAAALSPEEWLWAILIGLRFDLYTILLLNFPLFIFFLSPTPLLKQQITYKIATHIWVLVNIGILILNAIDVVYFGFAEKRLTHELFTTGKDLVNIDLGTILSYWGLLIVAGTMVFLLYRLIRTIGMRTQRKLALKNDLHRYPTIITNAIALISIGFLVLSGLEIKVAFNRSDNPFVGHASMNTALTVTKGLDLPRKIKPIFFSEQKADFREKFQNEFDTEPVNKAYPLVRKACFEGPEKRLNVVILILESFNASQVGCLSPSAKNSLSPYFDSLAQEGRLFTRFYANGTRSVEAMPAILNSIPEIFVRPTLSSRYEKHPHWGIGNMAQARGYHTSFFCGARNGTMGFDHYTRKSGLEHYYGMDNYPNKAQDYDGLWGIFDKPFMKWVAAKQNQFKEPFLSVYFSISNHHPYILPAEETELAKNRKLSKHNKSFKYMDKALEAYFEKVKNYDWYDRTIFVITGDHCFHHYSNPDRPLPENFHIPLLLIAPGLTPGKDSRIASQTGVLPTLIELLRWDTYHASTSRSLIATQNSPVFAHLMGLHILLENEQAVVTNQDKYNVLYEWKDNKWLKTSKNISPEYRKQAVYLHQNLYNLRVANRIMHQQFMQYPISCP